MKVSFTILAIVVMAVAGPVPAPAPTPAPAEVARAGIQLCPQTICPQRREIKARGVLGWDAVPTGLGEVKRNVGEARRDIIWGIVEGGEGSAGKRDVIWGSVPDWDNAVATEKRQVVTPTCHC